MSPPARLSRVFLDVADPVEGAEEDDEGTYVVVGEATLGSPWAK